MTADQLQLPGLLETFDVNDYLQGKVYRIEDGRWRAEISNGWWFATRPTKTTAIQAVIDLYYNEKPMDTIIRVQGDEGR